MPRLRAYTMKSESRSLEGLPVGLRGADACAGAEKIDIVGEERRGAGRYGKKAGKGR